MTINIFILNWNSSESTKNCLDSIVASDDKSFRIILINNFYSKVDLVDIRSTYKSFKSKIEIYLVENDTNLGYAGGNNKGLKFLEDNKLQGDILILNPDILVLKNTISEMRKALVNGVGIVTVRTLNSEGKILFDAINFNGFMQSNVISGNEVFSTNYSQGSCMLIKRSIIDQIGLFDERFFLYWEEIDFSIRVKNLGQKLISTTITQIIKKSNSESRQPISFYYSVRNAKLIKEKHGGEFSNLAYLKYLLKMLLLTFKFILKPKLFLKVILNYFSAIHDSFLNKFYSKPV